VKKRWAEILLKPSNTIELRGKKILPGPHERRVRKGGKKKKGGAGNFCSSVGKYGRDHISPDKKILKKRTLWWLKLAGATKRENVGALSQKREQPRKRNSVCAEVRTEVRTKKRPSLSDLFH